jgi:hypothetical protein
MPISITTSRCCPKSVRLRLGRARLHLRSADHGSCGTYRLFAEEPRHSALPILDRCAPTLGTSHRSAGSTRGRDHMRSSCTCIALAALILGICTSMGAAQPQSEDKKSGDSPWSTGRTVLPDNQGQPQPQGWTGPLSTGTGGAPPTSPQGGTPPDMQPAPGGATESIVDPPPRR